MHSVLLWMAFLAAPRVGAWIPRTPTFTHLHRSAPSVSSSSIVRSSLWHGDNDNNDQYKQDQEGNYWSTADDWTALSAQENRPVEGMDIFHQDVALRAAERLEAATEQAAELSAADAWLHESIGTILNPSVEDEEATATTSSHKDNDEAWRRVEIEGNEVARLVRCQEVPQGLLIAEGRAVADLTWEAAHDVRQLISWNSDNQWWQPTPFLQQAVATLFRAHATTTTTTAPVSVNDNDNDEKEEPVLQWDAASVASWMCQCLQEQCGKHEGRVVSVLSKFGTKGWLQQQGLVDLYVHALVGDAPRGGGGGGGNAVSGGMTPVQVEQAYHRFMTSDEIAAVWRDFKRHGIQSPAEQAHAEAAQAIQDAHHHDNEATGNGSSSSSTLLFMDECEIVDNSIPDGWYKDEKTGTWQRHGKSSHEKVALADDGKTPLWLQDGDYVYIDEESCIGCTQCALAAPASFQMLENGRARTFVQRGRIPDVTAAVKTCPVNCMHYVDFDRLRVLEQARDSHDGDDGRTDHRHFGRVGRQDKWRAHTPLHVSRMESSDANHKDSLYHHIRRQCYQSNQCPQKGCYDCPLHTSNPEANPHLLKRRQKNNHMRAQTFQDNGMADPYRNSADL